MVRLLRRHLPLARFAGDRSAIAAIEFALVVPIMLTLYIAGLQLSEALTINRKVTHVSSTLADLITQEKSLSSAEFAKILDVSSAIMTPYSASNLRIKVSQIEIDSKGKATVSWSKARNDTPLIKNDPYDVPAALKSNDTYLITAEIHYSYTPPIGYIITGTFDLHDGFYLRPRTSKSIPLTN